MRKIFTQGSIIEDIRTAKYSNTRCKGVVITARCDIANGKVKSVHYLTALTMHDWLYEVLAPEILKDRRKEVLGSIKNFAAIYELDYDTLVNMEYAQVEQVLGTYATKKKEKEHVAQWMKAWKEYDELLSGSLTCEQRQSVLKIYNVEKLKKKILPLYNYNYPKYCFIPERAYLKEGSLTDGLVVDLQDIHQLSIEEAQDICSDKYDFKDVTDEMERKRIDEKFFFESEEDFVIMDSVIESPWNERLLQEFTYMFSRIGVDNASEDEIGAYCKEVLGEIR